MVAEPAGLLNFDAHKAALQKIEVVRTEASMARAGLSIPKSSSTEAGISKVCA